MGIVVAQHRGTGGAAHCGHFVDPGGDMRAALPDGPDQVDKLGYGHLRTLRTFGHFRGKGGAVDVGYREIRHEVERPVLQRDIGVQKGHRGVVVERD